MGCEAVAVRTVLTRLKRVLTRLLEEWYGATHASQRDAVHLINEWNCNLQRCATGSRLGCCLGITIVL